jgi:inhibitor of cysteine peptidase
MKNVLSFVCGASLFLSTYGYAADMPKSVALTDANKAILVVTKDQPSFTIALPANPSTGYIWLVQSYDAKLLKLSQHHYLASNKKSTVGAPGVEDWVFHVKSKVVAPQITKITLVHARPWEIVEAKGEEKTFTIVVE